MNSLNALVNSGEAVLVDFFAEWCGPCKQQAPQLKMAKEALGDGVRIVKVDIDKAPAVARQYNIQGVPTLILFKNGQIKWRQSGVVPAQALVQVVHQHQ